MRSFFAQIVCLLPPNIVRITTATAQETTPSQMVINTQKRKVIFGHIVPHNDG